MIKLCFLMSVFSGVQCLRFTQIGNHLESRNLRISNSLQSENMKCSDLLIAEKGCEQMNKLFTGNVFCVLLSSTF